MIEPFFLAGSRGALFAVYHPPAVGIVERSGVLCFPPCAEEMNEWGMLAAGQSLEVGDINLLLPMNPPLYSWTNPAVVKYT